PVRKALDSLPLRQWFAAVVGECRLFQQRRQGTAFLAQRLAHLRRAPEQAIVHTHVVIAHLCTLNIAQSHHFVRHQRPATTARHCQQCRYHPKFRQHASRCTGPNRVAAARTIYFGCSSVILKLRSLRRSVSRQLIWSAMSVVNSVPPPWFCMIRRELK